MTVILLPSEGRPVSRWKNGGGYTSEVAIFPPGADIAHFDWRVSIAEIRESGPFSLFPGIDRCLAVLEGTVLLHVGEAAPMKLSPRSVPFAFAGDIPCRAEIAGHGVRDLNVMTRRGRFLSDMNLAKGDGVLAASPACATLLLSLGDAVIEADGTTIPLKPLDAVCRHGEVADPIPYSCRPSTAGPDGLYVVRIFRTAPGV